MSLSQATQNQAILARYSLDLLEAYMRLRGNVGRGSRGREHQNCLQHLNVEFTATSQARSNQSIEAKSLVPFTRLSRRPMALTPIVSDDVTHHET
jgi:hypothetical protein